MTEQRRLAAILVADVVGYSKLIGSDEAGTLAQLEALRTEIIGPQVVGILYRLGAAHRLDGAGELDQKAVTH